MSCEQLFREQLKKKGLRLTSQRKLVLEVLHHQDGPVSADMVYDLVHQIDLNLDRSTIYRTLDLLKEFGIVQQIQSNDRYHFYEHTGTTQPHIHMVCQKCGKIFIVEQQLFDNIQQSLENKLGFTPDWSQMTIPGLCEKCQTNLSTEI
jgi:Fur family ferric uptake transcriptional regulator